MLVESPSSVASGFPWDVYGEGDGETGCTAKTSFPSPWHQGRLVVSTPSSHKKTDEEGEVFHMGIEILHQFSSSLSQYPVPGRIFSGSIPSVAHQAETMWLCPQINQKIYSDLPTDFLPIVEVVTCCDSDSRKNHVKYQRNRCVSPWGGVKKRKSSFQATWTMF